MPLPCSFHSESCGILSSQGTPGKPVAGHQSNDRTTPARFCLEAEGSLGRRLSYVAADTEQLYHARHMHICKLSAPGFAHVKQQTRIVES